MRNLIIDTPEGTAFIEEHFGDLRPVRVPLTRNMTTGQCYGNVRAMIRNEGGRARWGWLLLEKPDRYYEAMHHAVWQNDAGEMEDVTARGSTHEKTDHALFIPDDTVQPSDHEPAVSSKFRQLDGSTNIRTWIEGNQLRMSLIARANKILRALPHRVANGGIEITSGEIPKELLSLQRDIDVLTRQLQTLNREIMEGRFE